MDYIHIMQTLLPHRHRDHGVLDIPVCLESVSDPPLCSIFMSISFRKPLQYLLTVRQPSRSMKTGESSPQ